MTSIHTKSAAQNSTAMWQNIFLKIRTKICKQKTLLDMQASVHKQQVEHQVHETLALLLNVQVHSHVSDHWNNTPNDCMQWFFLHCTQQQLGLGVKIPLVSEYWLKCLGSKSGNFSLYFSEADFFIKQWCIEQFGIICYLIKGLNNIYIPWTKVLRYCYNTALNNYCSPVQYFQYSVLAHKFKSHIKNVVMVNSHSNNLRGSDNSISRMKYFHVIHFE